MTVDIPEEYEDDLRKFSEKQNVDFQTVTDVYETKYNKLDGRHDEDRRHRIAWQGVRSALVETRSIQGETVSVIAIGHSVQWWGGDSGRPVVIGHGVVRPEEEQMGLGVFILDSDDGVSPDNATTQFNFLNTFRTEFSVSPEAAISDGYVLNVADDTDLGDPEEATDFPDDPSDLREAVHRFTDEVQIADLVGPAGPRGLSKTETTDSGTRAADFGIDLKRISEASVTDAYRDYEEDFGVITILDETVVDPDELKGTVLMGDDQNTAGLTCWTDPATLDFGKGTVCDIYGVVSEREGQITMDTRGVEVLLHEPYDSDDEESSTSGELQSF